MHVVAHFEIPYYQILTHDALEVASLPLFAQNKDYLVSLYHSMLRARIFDQKAVALQRMGKLGTYPSMYGQEAISTAIGHALSSTDVFVPYYRDHAALMQRGVKMSDLLSYWGGDERGSADCGVHDDLPICVPIATQCLHATGIAFAFKHRREARVALVSIGDGGTSEGDFYEAINAAGVWNLPVVFVINNNQWAISVPLEQQTATQTLAQKAIAAGISGIQVDGNDLLATHQVLSEALDKARRLEGPTLIEALSYRLSDHTTADDATRYQAREEVEDALLKEPIQRFKTFLERHIQWTDEDEQSLIKTSELEVHQAIEDYLHRPNQPISSLFDYHFADLPEYLIEQRAMAMEALTYA